MRQVLAWLAVVPALGSAALSAADPATLQALRRYSEERERRTSGAVFRWSVEATFWQPGSGPDMATLKAARKRATTEAVAHLDRRKITDSKRRSEYVAFRVQAELDRLTPRRESWRSTWRFERNGSLSPLPEGERLPVRCAPDTLHTFTCVHWLGRHYGGAFLRAYDVGEDGLVCAGSTVKMLVDRQGSSLTLDFDARDARATSSLREEIPGDDNPPAHVCYDYKEALHGLSGFRSMLGLFILLWSGALMNHVTITPEGPPRRIVTDAGASGYQAFPDVCRLKNGDLLCVFYAGYGHVSQPNEALPQGGRICAVRSTDEGKTWSDPWVVVDTPKDDRDPSVCCLPDGTLLCNFFAYGKHAEYDTCLIRSTDGGKTWSEPEVIVPGYATSSPIRRLRSGRLLLPVYTVDGGGKRAFAAVCISRDRGKTWSAPRPIGLDAGKTLDETDFYERKDGTLLAVMREVMCGAESRDGGWNWGPVYELGFPGHCPYLLMTRQDVLLLAHRLPNTSLHYSTDEGHTWHGPIEIDAVIGAYPSLVELKDGRVLCVYYEEGANSAIRAVTLRVEVSPGR